ncbi:MAG: hypothetical protein ACK5AZ_18565 [Bryobacteraceae bacterium]
MLFRVSGLCLLLAGLLIPGEAPKHPQGRNNNNLVDLAATLYSDKESITELLGSDLGGYVYVVEVKLRARTDKPVRIEHDDFTLRSHRDGQRSEPFTPSQIAGDTTLVVSSRGMGGGGIMSNPTGPVWGGLPGTMGGPGRMGGPGGVVGNSGEPEVADARVENAPGAAKENPLLAILAEKMLPEMEMDDEASGLLYFLMEGKHKTKDLELIYKGAGARLSIRFR